MNNTFLDVAHFVSLRNAGGLEQCYLEYINHSAPQFRHHTILPRPEIAEELKTELENGSYSVSCYKKWGSLRLPSHPVSLRKWNVKRILGKSHAGVIVFWNAPGAPILRSLPEDLFVIYYEHGAAWKKRADSGVNDTLKVFDGIICNSKASKRYLELRWHLDLSSAQIVLNGVRPSCVPSYVREKTLGSSRHLTIGVAGRLVPIKGMCLAIQSLAILRSRGIDAILLIAGRGVERARLEELSRSLGVEKEVSFLGHVHDMKEFFRRIHLFLVPSIQESFGLACVEAMANGVPVIASNVDGLGELVEDGVTGFLIEPELPIEMYPSLGGTLAHLPEYVYDPVKDTLSLPRMISPERVADQVLQLIGDLDLYRRMCKKARERALSAFCFTRYAKELDSILSSYASHSASGYWMAKREASHA